jgi:guanosine-3',5'-bis(diphosphate) 3'-pyrophosphohydrolase
VPRHREIGILHVKIGKSCGPPFRLALIAPRIYNSGAKSRRFIVINMPYTCLLAALDFAAEKHLAQRRRSAGDVPYINHPIRVARLLAEVGGVDDDEVLAAAVLHDTLEDTATTRDELDAAFGPVIRRIVEEVTDDGRLPKAERKRLQIVHAPKLSAAAAQIKLADKIANVTDIIHAPPVDWPPERIREYIDWAEAVVRELPKVNAALEARFAEVLGEARRVYRLRANTTDPASVD